MNKRMTLSLPLFIVLAFSPWAFGQGMAPAKASAQQATPSAEDTQQKNAQEYIELLRRNVRQEKDEIMGVVMQLDIEQSANSGQSTTSTMPN